jgi:hypothetical protein
VQEGERRRFSGGIGLDEIMTGLGVKAEAVGGPNYKDNDESESDSLAN